jgi:putative component of toxin-antitoxin plasmid stabilization module
MRIHFGPGYRVYYTRREELVYLLLIGGDKSSQSRDIRRAKKLASDLKAADANRRKGASPENTHKSKRR